MRNDEVLKRLQNLIKYIPQQKELVQKTGINQSTLSTKKQRNSQWTDEEIKSLNDAYNIDIYRNISQIEINSDINGDYFPDVFGSCGEGTFILSETKEPIKIPEQYFNKPVSKVKKYSVINAHGNSMEPNILDKDKLIVEHLEYGEQIIDNKIYVFCYNNEIYVKRLYKNIDEIIVKSDNPDPIFKTKFIQKEEMNNLIVIGQIAGIFRDLR